MDVTNLADRAFQKMQCAVYLIATSRNEFLSLDPPAFEPIDCLGNGNGVLGDFLYGSPASRAELLSGSQPESFDSTQLAYKKN